MRVVSSLTYELLSPKLALSSVDAITAQTVGRSHYNQAGVMAGRLRGRLRGSRLRGRLVEEVR